MYMPLLSSSMPFPLYVWSLQCAPGQTLPASQAVQNLHLIAAMEYVPLWAHAREFPTNKLSAVVRLPSRHQHGNMPDCCCLAAVIVA